MNIFPKTRGFLNCIFPRYVRPSAYPSDVLMASPHITISFLLFARTRGGVSRIPHVVFTMYTPCLLKSYLFPGETIRGAPLRASARTLLHFRTSENSENVLITDGSFDERGSRILHKKRRNPKFNRSTARRTPRV